MNEADNTANDNRSDHLVEALRGLPPVAASPGFTARVLARAVAPAESESGLGWSRGWALFAASLVAVSAFAAWLWER